MGGLIVRAGRRGRRRRPSAPWTELVSDVVTLGTPHLGAPIARGIGHGSRGLARLPETAAFGRILDWRSVGVHDLVAGLAEDVPPLPHARYRLVAATLTTRPRHPVGHVVGDLLVRVPSAYGRDRCGARAVPRRRRAARRPDRPLRPAQPPRGPRAPCETGSRDAATERADRELRAEADDRRPARAGVGAADRLLPDARVEPRAGADGAAQARRPAGRAVVPRHQPPQGRRLAHPQRRGRRSSPAGALAWDTRSSGAPLDLGARARTGDGTRVVHRRPVPRRLTAAEPGCSRRSLLGGSDGHADELEAGMAQTVARLKAAAEA